MNLPGLQYTASIKFVKLSVKKVAYETPKSSAYEIY